MQNPCKTFYSKFTSGLVEKSRTESSTLVVMFVFVTLIVLVNIVVIFGLMKGRQTRGKLINGLLYRRDRHDRAVYSPVTRDA